MTHRCDLAGYAVAIYERDGISLVGSALGLGSDGSA